MNDRGVVVFSRSTGLMHKLPSALPLRIDVVNIDYATDPSNLPYDAHDTPLDAVTRTRKTASTRQPSRQTP